MIQNREELEEFKPANGVSEANKALWIELWEKGFYVQPVGQIHIGEIDYLIVSCQSPKPESIQAFLSSPN